ncbi:uncharacterized protein LOC127104351 [Lathyrus oleraceus]|uniref:uncharacterized protein LOC127104351 n=1 Tax=Pisum sativum TaxID=3888 RepID=UPI0021D0DDA5|nr:uncharacterized protein LOC127104351 [Pisum sativum]
MEAWNHLEDIFQDNQNARVVTLEKEFSNTRMEDFPNVSTYCHRLKMLSGQLRNVGSPVNNHHLVLQLISGLLETYRSVATLIRQSNPLLAFYQARSMLTLEEADMATMENTGSHASMHTTHSKPTEDISQYDTPHTHNRSRSRGNQGRGTGRGNRSTPQSGAPNAPSPWSAPPWQQQHQYPTWHKKNYYGSFERYKARLVGDGSSHVAGVDCDKTFSSVVKPATIRTMLTIALSKS